MMDRKPVRNM